MTFLTWVALGLVSGFAVSKFINKSGQGLVFDIVLGVVGAGFGGWLFKTFGTPDGGLLNFQGISLIIVGALAVPIAHHVFVRDVR